jgi:predicted RNA binding protein YcfA (HicA-like mRNA interferase family)
LRVPRDLSGHDLAKGLRRYGYEVVRQSGSHLQLKSSLRSIDHHITVPAHKTLKLGTLSGIISGVAIYLELDKAQLAEELFGL